ncbi:MAG: hypothetical protein P1V51_13870 [Deltaproteobacteria bacterium]|nr:hypothetical protein [Deltaproteobacteria bacterium]
MPDPTERLLAVDLGLRTGLAVFGRDGRLLWYRSRNFGTLARLRKAARSILEEAAPLSVVALEGGGGIALPWEGEVQRRGLVLIQCHAEAWRRELLLSRHQRSGPDAKKHADTLARAIIEWSGAKRPTSLRHDAAEAICLGLWAVHRQGWLREYPSLTR